MLKKMHELSIATNIFDIAGEYAEKAKAKAVLEIEIEVGELSGVVIEALEFAMENIEKSRVLKNAKWNINKIPGKVLCQNCHYEFDTDDFYTACPKCGEYRQEIVQGRELRVKSITVD
jgi:hydrogenase nickel incorporation protein HypA/HybF